MIEAPLGQRKGESVSRSRSSGKVETTLEQRRRLTGSFLEPGGRIMNLVAARPSWGLVVLRLVVGGVFIDSGSRKLFQVGVVGVASLFASMHLPLPLLSAVLLTLLEVLGGIALLLGLFTRGTAALLAVDMLVAVLIVYFEPTFFKAGVQLPLTMLAGSIALALSGPGALSLDGTKALAGARRSLLEKISS